MEGKTYYKILNIQPKSTQKEIKIAFKKLIKQHHPDKHLSTENEDLSFSQNLQYKKQASMKIIQAYQCLIDPQKRLNYDHWLNTENLKIQLSQNRHKDTISLSKTAQNFSTQSAETSNQKSHQEMKQDEKQIENNLQNESFNSDDQEDHSTIIVCQQCFGEMQIQNEQFRQLHLKQLSINCQHCGLYITVVQ